MNSAAHTELERLAEADGAMFTPNGTGSWRVQDRHGVIIVRGALSRAEAALIYCEDQHLVASTPEAILAYLKAQYRPYDTLPEFQEGFDAYQKVGPHRCSRYDDGYKAQAWDRGANVAMQYQRALAHRAITPTEADEAEPGWLVKLLRTGRR
jgi:hypothetical protein